MGHNTMQNSGSHNRRKYKIIALTITLCFISALSTVVVAYLLHPIEDGAIRTGGDTIALSPTYNAGQSLAQGGTAPDNRLDVTEKDGISWNQLEKLNIFNNPKYEGEKIIVPGSQGSYYFTLLNKSESVLDCLLTFAETNDYGVVMKYRLRTEQSYIFGDENNWITADGLADVKAVINVNNQQKYILDWIWVFEDATQETDRHDTSLGNTAYAENVPYILEMNVMAEQDTDSPKTPGTTPGTGDNDNVRAALIVLCFASLIIVLFIFREREKGTAVTQNVVSDNKDMDE